MFHICFGRCMPGFPWEGNRPLTFWGCIVWVAVGLYQRQVILSMWSFILHSYRTPCTNLTFPWLLSLTATIVRVTKYSHLFVYLCIIRTCIQCWVYTFCLTWFVTFDILICKLILHIVEINIYLWIYITISIYYWSRVEFWYYNYRLFGNYNSMGSN